MQAKHALFEEVKEINQQLIDAVVDLSDEDTIPTAAAAATVGGEGTIVKCSVSLSPNYKSQQLSAQIVRFQAFQSKLFINYMHYFFYPSY